MPETLLGATSSTARRAVAIQTFLPYSDFAESASVLDDKRLGKQAVECKQILMVHLDQTEAYRHHPAVLMWKGYVPSLFRYMAACLAELDRRGRKTDVLREWAIEEHDKVVGPGALLDPPWMGDDDVHRSHRSNLIRKNNHYIWAERDDWPYIWPEPLSPTVWTVRLSVPDIRRVKVGLRTLPAHLAGLDAYSGGRRPVTQIRGLHL